MSFSQAEIATQRPNPWRIVSAICVQRLPTITKQKSELERAMAELKWKQAEERSVLSGWEMKEMERERNRQLSEERKTKDEDEDDDDDDGTISRRSTADEDEDEIRELELKEFESFRAASRETDADATNDRRSLERKLSETLYLLVKKPRDRNAWQMPQGGWERGETMKEAAMRELREECGDELSVRVLGNLPWLFYSYRFPREHLSPDGSLGAKVRLAGFSSAKVDF